MIVKNILKDWHTEKDAKTLAAVMGYLSAIHDMINKTTETLDGFTFQSNDLLKLNRIVSEAKGLFSDFSYDNMRNQILNGETA